MRVIISGGGTGGHIFPAISIANSIKELEREAEILFVGAHGRMEMERVPAAGYKIEGIPARGLKRPLYSPGNLLVAIDYLKCIVKARKILTRFKPDLVVGVGGYASAAIVAAAAKLNIPILLQEQNSYAGLVNKKNGKHAAKICVAYQGMERFFPKEKIALTGNPVRKDIVAPTAAQQAEGLRHYGLKEGRPTIFVVGGSLGCRTLNECIKNEIEHGSLFNGGEGSVNLIWQCGKYYKAEIDSFMAGRATKGIYYSDFIQRMDLAYAASDIVISRAGAGTISELAIAGKCTIFVPSPVVAEDHQTHNAMALVNKGAAAIVKDSNANKELIPAIKELLASPRKRESFEKNILTFAKPNAAKEIASYCIELAQKRIENIYFIGIGGIGMSAIARYYNHAGYKVSGYDRTSTPLTLTLESEGIKIHYKANISAIPKERDKTLVIYTPAIPADFEELRYIESNGYKIVKRSKALGEIAKGQYTLAVAGTHGKTTTSTLLAHLLKEAGRDCSAFLGGLSKNYDTNLLLGKEKILVAEADEFDRSFLQLYPNVAIVTSIDADHLDIYKTYNAVKEAFAAFAAQVKEDGTIILKKGVTLDLSATKAKCYSYSLEEQADFYGSEIAILEGGYYKFNLVTPWAAVKDCVMGVPGRLNAENGVAAAAAALACGADAEGVKIGLKSFMGVKRRLDAHINSPKIAYIDDYAHHPKELSSAIASLREIFPGREICGVFQPHLYSRTRDFAADFAESLSLLDKLILTQIYPAREEPIEGVSSQIIFDKVTIENKVLLPKEELLSYLEREPIDVLATFGAGDIDKFIKPITEMLSKRVAQE